MACQKDIFLVMSIQTFVFILLSQAPPDIVFELCEYQPKFNRSSEIDRVFSGNFFFEFSNVYSVNGA